MERVLLGRLLGGGDWMLDVGGGYGRLLDVYRGRFRNVVIVDHSLSMLQDAQARLRRTGDTRVALVAANAYSLPFIDGCFDQAMMIRMIHHLDDPPAAIRSIQRVLRPGGEFVLEYQNNCNINTRIKHLFGRGSANPEDTRPVRQRQELYWNFHPRYIRSCVEPHFEVTRTLGGGIFWNRDCLVKLLPRPEWVDSVFARHFGAHAATHEMFLSMRRRPAEAAAAAQPAQSVSDLLACSRCGRTELASGATSLACESCRASFPIHDGIYDFR